MSDFTDIVLKAPVDLTGVLVCLSLNVLSFCFNLIMKIKLLILPGNILVLCSMVSQAYFLARESREDKDLAQINHSAVIMGHNSGDEWTMYMGESYIPSASI